MVGTLNALYAQVAEDEARAVAGETAEAEAEEEAFGFWKAVSEAAATVPENLASLSDTFLDPLGIGVGETEDVEAAAEEQDVDVATYGAITQLFGSAAAAFAYQVLILLYFPCVAVMGAVRQEVGLRWSLFMALWCTIFGYSMAVLCYQALTFAAHPASSFLWCLGILGLLALTLLGMGRHGGRRRQPGLQVAGA